MPNFSSKLGGNTRQVIHYYSKTRVFQYIWHAILSPKNIQSNSIIVEKMVAQKFSTILEFSTIMDFCVVQGNELSDADRVYCINCEFLFTA